MHACENYKQYKDDNSEIINKEWESYNSRTMDSE
jgi:hypothetical protein